MSGGGIAQGGEGRRGKTAGLGFHAADSFFNTGANITTRATNRGHEKLLADAVIQHPGQALQCAT